MASTNREVLEALRSSFPQLFSRREENGQVVERIDLEQIRLLAGEGNYSDRYGLRWENKPERFDADSVGKAWRNLMVCAVNAALEQKLFSLRPGDNRFPDNMRQGELFDFVLPNGLPAKGSVSDAGFNEVAVHAAVNPKGNAVRAYNAGFDAGDAFGTTWVERERGAWMQSSDSTFTFHRHTPD